MQAADDQQAKLRLSFELSHVLTSSNIVGFEAAHVFSSLQSCSSSHGRKQPEAVCGKPTPLEQSNNSTAFMIVFIPIVLQNAGG